MALLSQTDKKNYTKMLKWVAKTNKTSRLFIYLKNGYVASNVFVAGFNFCGPSELW